MDYAQRWRPVCVDEVLDDDEDSAWSIDGVVDLRDDTNPEGPIVQVTAIGE